MEATIYGLGFPKIRGTILGVPIISFLGVYIGVPLFWETTIYHNGGGVFNMRWGGVV